MEAIKERQVDDRPPPPPADPCEVRSFAPPQSSYIIRLSIQPPYNNKDGVQSR